jgi:hypothetical protein
MTREAWNEPGSDYDQSRQAATSPDRSRTAASSHEQPEPTGPEHPGQPASELFSAWLVRIDHLWISMRLLRHF